METHAKNRAPTGKDQHLSTFSSGQVARGQKKVATVSAGLFANIFENWQQAHVL